MAKPEPQMIRIDIRVTPKQLERADDLASALTSDRPDVMRTALDLGFDQLELRQLQHWQYLNAKLVNAKLGGRKEKITEALDLLSQDGADIEDRIKKAISLLEGAIG
jgi:hypothetical protein